MKVKTWDGHSINDGTNYVTVLTADAYGLPETKALLAARQGRWPLIGGIERAGRELYLDISVTGASVETLQRQLYQWFDAEDEIPVKLVVEDDAGGNDRYVYGLCERLYTMSTAYGFHYLAVIMVHGDIRWREVTASTDTWNITATGQTKVIANAGKDDAYPVLKVKPTSGKTGGYAYWRFVPVRWRVSSAYNDYPIDICNDSFNTQTLVSGGKMQADGDDLRVFVDGVEVDRWLDGINTTTTKVWINMDFQAKQEVTLKTAIPSTAWSGVFQVNEDISGFPSKGTVMVGDEAFTYFSKNNSLREFLEVIRAAKGTTAAVHSIGDTVYWLQHEAIIWYGNSSVSAPTVDDKVKPIFALASSTNTSWDYDDFRDAAGLRTGRWAKVLGFSNVSFYGGDRGAAADPYAELGIKVIGDDIFDGEGRYQLYNPCGLTNANFANGEKYATKLTTWQAYIRSAPSSGDFITEDSIAQPTVASTWQSWSDNQALTSGSVWVELDFLIEKGTPSDGETHNLECADVTVTLNSSNAPVITVGSEQGGYNLACTITNNTTGDAIGLGFMMDLNQELEVDTSDKTVIYLKDTSNQFQALTLTEGARRDWLKLQAGNNTLQYDETGVAGVTVTLSWEERNYD